MAGKYFGGDTQRGNWRADFVVGVRIARAQIRDVVRRNASTRREQAILGLIALFGFPVLLFSIQQGYAVGVLTRDGVDAPVVETARNLLVPGLVVLGVFGGLGAAQSLARDSVRPLLLTGAPTRAVVLGKLLYLFATWVLPLGLGLVVTLAYSVGAGTPLFVLAVLVAGLPVLVLALLLGLSLAYLLWLGVELLGLPEWARRIVTASISLVAFLAAFGVGILSGQTTAVGTLPTGDPVTPLGWYADLLFVGSPMAEPIRVRSVVAGIVVAGAIPLVFGGLVRLAPKYWYATPERAETADTSDGVPVFERTPSETIGRISATDGGSVGSLLAHSRAFRATLGHVRNGSRRPDQYVYLFYYLFPVVAVVLPQAVESPGDLPIALGAATILLGVWFAGGVFCLNPLGVEGAMLSQLVLAAVPAKTFVHGRLLAGLVVGIPFALVGVLLLGAFLPVVTPGVAVVGTVLALGVVVTSAAFALGIGSVLPKFETTEVFDSVETLAPSIIAAIIHGAITLALTIAGLGVTVLIALPESTLAASERLVLGGGFIMTVVTLADGSRRYAIARFRDYGRPVARPGRPFTVYFALGLAVLAFILGQAVALGVVLLLGVDVSVGLLVPVLFVVEYLGYALVAVGFVYVTHRGWSYFDFAWPSGRELGYVAGGVVGSLVIWAVGTAAITGLGLPAADHALFDPTDDTDPSLLLLLIPLVLFVNGPVEELLYRNVVQKYLAERFSTLTAVGIASAIFALAHLPAYFTANPAEIGVTLGLLFVVSCLWGAFYAHTRSLVVVSAIHGLYNAVLLGMVYATTV